jgi:hypothetical protein
MTTKLAIMQPYCFPYLGYYQLIAAVDKFIIYDDVNFIKQGWINRNRILVNHQPSLFVIPLQGANPFAKIQHTQLHPQDYPRWCGKFLKTLEVNYRKAPQFAAVQPLVQTVLESVLPQLSQGESVSISRLALASLEAIATYLALPTQFIPSSEVYGTADLPPQEKLIQMYRAEQADLYINPSGGSDLFDRPALAAAGVTVQFLQCQARPYGQFREPFVPGLSMIDVLMFNAIPDVQQLLQEYQLW